MKSLAIVELDAFDAAEEALTRTTPKRYVSTGDKSANTGSRTSKASLFSYAQSEINQQRQSPMFSLPGEIRNKIMELSLVPGTLYLKNPFVKPKTYAHYTHGWRGDRGLAYLAACRRAHQEGHEYYYGRNMFYLPPGNILYTLEFFYELDPKHAALISSLGVNIGLSHLTLDMFDATMKDYTNSEGQITWETPDLRHAVTAVISKVQETWLDKLDHISECQGYKEVKVQFDNSSVLLDGRSLAHELKGIASWRDDRSVDECNEQITQILRAAKLAFRWQLEFLLCGGGTTCVRKWITRGCVRPRLWKHPREE